MIIRYLHSHAGDKGWEPGNVPFSLDEARNILSDRCSAYWAIDASIGMWNCKNMTMACAPG